MPECSEFDEARPDTLFLIGMRASGKTTLGKALAARWKYAFRDTDAMVRETSGLDVADIVTSEGWAGFREREAFALRKAARPHSVVATGGGAILREDNRIFMRQAGICVYLEADCDLLCRRLNADPQAQQRPPLQASGNDDSPESSAARLAEVRGVLLERDLLYRQVTHYIVRADQSLPDLINQLTFQFSA